jgi:hypothetical protein
MLYPECFKRTETDSSFKSSISFDVKQSVGYAAKDLVTVTIAKYICSQCNAILKGMATDTIAQYVVLAYCNQGF